MRTRITTLLLVLALGGAIGCGESGPQSPAGGYDDSGFPLDESGNVSSNPDDYTEAICNSGAYDAAPDYQEKC